MQDTEERRRLLSHLDHNAVHQLATLLKATRARCVRCRSRFRRSSNPCVAKPAHGAGAQRLEGAQIRGRPDRTGRLDFADLGEALKQSTGLVSLMLPNLEVD